MFYRIVALFLPVYVAGCTIQTLPPPADPAYPPPSEPVYAEPAPPPPPPPATRPPSSPRPRPPAPPDSGYAEPAPPPPPPPAPTRPSQPPPPAPTRPSQPPPPPAPTRPSQPPQPPAWDPRGWALLGERSVDMRSDQDNVPVGKSEGSFTQLVIAAQDADCELFAAEVYLVNGQRLALDVRRVLRQGERTEPLDLPGEAQLIDKVVLSYGKLSGGGRARVQLWAKPTPGGRVHTLPPAWDSRGWTFIGEMNVGSRDDRDVLKVGKDNGPLRQLTVVVYGSDLELFEMTVRFASGQSFAPSVRRTFRDGSVMPLIDLPGQAQVIEQIDFRHGNLPGGGRARVQVWAR